MKTVIVCSVQTLLLSPIKNSLTYFTLRYLRNGLPMERFLIQPQLFFTSLRNLGVTHRLQMSAAANQARNEELRKGLKILSLGEFVSHVRGC